MSLQVEKLEKNMAKLTIEVSAEDFEKAVQAAYLKNKGRITLPGFRKGKAPRAMIEKMYGAGVFYEDAANALIPEAYAKAADESGLDIVAQPSISVEPIEKGKPFVFTAEVALKPVVTLGEYKGLEVEKKVIEVTEEEVNAAVDREREKNSRMIDIEDRTVENGDIVKLDFDGSVDGVPFQGGKAENYDLTIGSGSFIPGFEEQLIGAAIGEEKDVNVTFPEGYHAKELAGKAAVFKCKVNGIKVKELPEADDEFAKEVSEFETIAEYKEDLKKKLTEQKEKAANAEKQGVVVTKAVENASMEIPDAMVMEQVRRMMDDFARRIQSQGLSMEQYFQFTGTTAATMAEQMKPEALKRIQNSLVLEAIAKTENIEVSEERLDEELAKMAKMYRMEAAKLKEMMSDRDKEQIKNDIAIQEAVKMITDAAKEVEAVKEEKEEEKAE
ncbi:MAG: trigger factor [Clostridiales bacterium]|nr:trigger factor [Clostridiales bacterium]